MAEEYGVPAALPIQRQGKPLMAQLQGPSGRRGSTGFKAPRPFGGRQRGMLSRGSGPGMAAPPRSSASGATLHAEALGQHPLMQAAAAPAGIFSFASGRQVTFSSAAQQRAAAVLGDQDVDGPGLPEQTAWDQGRPDGQLPEPAAACAPSVGHPQPGMVATHSGPDHLSGAGDEHPQELLDAHAASPGQHSGALPGDGGELPGDGGIPMSSWGNTQAWLAHPAVQQLLGDDGGGAPSPAGCAAAGCSSAAQLVAEAAMCAPEHGLQPAATSMHQVAGASERQPDLRQQHPLSDCGVGPADASAQQDELHRLHAEPQPQAVWFTAGGSTLQPASYDARRRAAALLADLVEEPGADDLVEASPRQAAARLDADDRPGSSTAAHVPSSASMVDQPQRADNVAAADRAVQAPCCDGEQVIGRMPAAEPTQARRSSSGMVLERHGGELEEVPQTQPLQQQQQHGVNPLLQGPCQHGSMVLDTLLVHGGSPGVGEPPTQCLTAPRQEPCERGSMVLDTLLVHGGCPSEPCPEAAASSPELPGVGEPPTQCLTALCREPCQQGSMVLDTLLVHGASPGESCPEAAATSPELLGVGDLPTQRLTALCQEPCQLGSMVLDTLLVHGGSPGEPCPEAAATGPELPLVSDVPQAHPQYQQQGDGIDPLREEPCEDGSMVLDTLLVHGASPGKPCPEAADGHECDQATAMQPLDGGGDRQTGQSSSRQASLSQDAAAGVSECACLPGNEAAPDVGDAAGWAGPQATDPQQAPAPWATASGKPISLSKEQLAAARAVLREGEAEGAWEALAHAQTQNQGGAPLWSTAAGAAIAVSKTGMAAARALLGDAPASAAVEAACTSVLQQKLEEGSAGTGSSAEVQSATDAAALRQPEVGDGGIKDDAPAGDAALPEATAWATGAGKTVEVSGERMAAARAHLDMSSRTGAASMPAQPPAFAFAANSGAAKQLEGCSDPAQCADGASPVKKRLRVVMGDENSPATPNLAARAPVPHSPGLVRDKSLLLLAVGKNVTGA